MIKLILEILAVGFVLGIGIAAGLYFVYFVDSLRYRDEIKKFKEYWDKLETK